MSNFRSQNTNCGALALCHARWQQWKCRNAASQMSTMSIIQCNIKQWPLHLEEFRMSNHTPCTAPYHIWWGASETKGVKIEKKSSKNVCIILEFQKICNIWDYFIYLFVLEKFAYFGQVLKCPKRCDSQWKFSKPFWTSSVPLFEENNFLPAKNHDRFEHYEHNTKFPLYIANINLGSLDS